MGAGVPSGLQNQYDTLQTLKNSQTKMAREAKKVKNDTHLTQR